MRNVGSPFSNPPRTRAKVLDRLHEGHPGICKAKALARRYIWWPKIDADLERVVKSCGRCQEHGRMPLVAPLHPWEWPNRPRLRLHVDYASPFMRRMLLVILDVFSKWLEIHTVASATLQATTESTRASIATQNPTVSHTSSLLRITPRQTGLLNRWNTPHMKTGITPAELLLGQKPKTLLDLVKPNIAERGRRKQREGKKCGSTGLGLSLGT
ncbi:uncharacterized protein K02A2.6-like [Corticium candelabrum]|uniref:uncharacterized protein K02A2.6-like n=1 Tax=Corticium candelabrum TaxID=121492 RepID=UPI002E270B63|nr:uncharacterized protein K02A2.6-like [Corticium candelabrum]